MEQALNVFRAKDFVARADASHGDKRDEFPGPLYGFSS